MYEKIDGTSITLAPFEATMVKHIMLSEDSSLYNDTIRVVRPTDMGFLSECTLGTPVTLYHYDDAGERKQVEGVAANDHRPTTSTFGDGGIAGHTDKASLAGMAANDYILLGIMRPSFRDGYGGTGPRAAPGFDYGPPDFIMAEELNTMFPDLAHPILTAEQEADNLITGTRIDLIRLRLRRD